jgi:hypothetical protein
MTWWLSRAPAFRLYRRLGAGILWRSGEQAGQGEQHHPVFTEAGQMQRPYGTRSGSRVVHWEGPEPQSGLPGDGFQAEGPLRCRPPAESFDGAVDARVPTPLFFLPHKVPGIRFLRSEALYDRSYVHLAHPAILDLQFWRDRPKHIRHRRIWPTNRIPLPL